VAGSQAHADLKQWRDEFVGELEGMKRVSVDVSYTQKEELMQDCYNKAINDVIKMIRGE